MSYSRAIQNQHRTQSQQLQWRQKEPELERISTTEAPIQSQRRLPLEKNLNQVNFSYTIPSTEQVTEELMDVTINYCNVENPTERTARQQWIFEGEKKD